MEQEVWKAIAGHPGYEVSDHGRVRSPNKILKPSPRRYRPTGRLVKMVVNLSGHRMRSIHNLVLEAFVGPPPPGEEGCHGDRDPANNRLDNLRWDTHASNMADMKIHGSHFSPFGERRGERHANTTLTEAEVLAIRAHPYRRGLFRALAPLYAVSDVTIRRIWRREVWTHI